MVVTMDGIVEALKLVVVSFLVEILDSGLCVNSQWHSATNHSIFSTAEINVSHMAKVWGLIR